MATDRRRSVRMSVVINTFNRCQSLEQTLRSLQQQTYDAFEVIVVNGPSTDGTREMLATWADRIIVADCPVANISKSRNIGIQASSGEVVAFIDDDAIPEPDWLEKLAAPYKDPRVGGVGGIVWDHTGVALQYRFSLCDRLGRTTFTGCRPDPFATHARADSFIYLQGTNSSFHRHVLERVGGFDEEIEYYHDETDLAARISEIGSCLVPLPDGAVHHKYLASHLRTPDRTVLEPYPIVKNSWYFALVNGTGRYPREEILRHLDTLTADVHDHAVTARRNGRMSAAQREYFHRRVEEGRAVGRERGESLTRKLASIAPADPDRFRPFPTLRPSGPRLVTCFVTNEYPPEGFGGIGRFTNDLAEGMSARGHQVHVLTRSPDNDRVDWENGVWVHRIRSRPANDLQGVSCAGNLRHAATIHEHVRQLDSRFKLDVVSAPLWASEGLFCALDRRLPSVLTLMTSQKTIGEIDPVNGRRPLWQQQIALERIAVRSTPFIHAISDAILHKTVADYGPTAANAAVAYLGVRDIRDRHPRSRTADDGEVRVLCVGRLEPRKGTDILLAAAERLCAAHANVRFMLVGRDNGGNGVVSYEREFVKRARHLVDSGRVTFAGAVSEEELGQHYADADVFVLPSRYESFGLVVLEAMGFGLPVVASNAGGVAEIVTPHTGILVDSDDVGALVAAVDSLVADAGLRAAMGKRARHAFEERWSLDRAVDRTVDAYARFADRHREQVAAGPLPTDLDCADRLVAAFAAEPLLSPLTPSTARRLFGSGHSERLVQGVSEAWFWPRKPFVKRVFKTILGRSPERESVRFFVNMLRHGATRRYVVEHIALSPEARSLEIPDDWFTRLPDTHRAERHPALFQIYALAVSVPALFRREGVIRKVLRRYRTRRQVSRAQRPAAAVRQRAA
jgi:glycogen(starch) synthase